LIRLESEVGNWAMAAQMSDAKGDLRGAAGF